MPDKIISGGQTGADQGGLEGARILGIATGGWIPRGCRTETGPNPEMAALYGLKEHPSPDYPPRTRQNVKDANGTIWIGTTTSRGYICTFNAVDKQSKPFLNNPDARTLRQWCEQWNIRILNVAGNAASKDPGIHQRTVDLILEAFGG